MKKHALFYSIVFMLLAIVFFLFGNAYQELNHYTDLTNRSNTVYNRFQNLSKQINNAAVINPDLIRAEDSSRGSDLFYADSSTVLSSLYLLDSTVKDPINIHITKQLDTIIRAELSWVLRSNVPDSILHHRAQSHVAKMIHIDALISQGIARTNFLLQTHKKALHEAIMRVEIWMVIFIILTAILLTYTTISLLRQRAQTKSTQRDLTDTERQYRSTLDNMLEGVQIHDYEWRYTYVNDALVKYSTYTREELMGHTLMERYPGIEASDLFKTMKRCMDERTSEVLDTEFVFPNGTKAFFELSIQPTPGGLFILSVDITARKKAEDQLQKSNRLYAFISAINQSIVHIDNEEELLANACMVATTVGGFNVVRIGMLDENGKVVNRSSQTENLNADQIQRYTNIDYTTPEMRGTLTGRVLVTGQYAVSNDIEKDEEMPAVMRDEMVAGGIRSAISLPIKKQGKIAGVLGLTGSSTDFFDRQEIDLLLEAVGDISFALDIFEKEKCRKLAEAKLEQSEWRLKQSQTIAHLGNWELDLATGISTWSEENCRIFGVPVEENQQSINAYLAFVHPDDRAYVSAIIEKGKNTHEDSVIIHRIMLRDGTLKHVRNERRFMFDHSGEARGIYGICHDITQARIAEEHLVRANRLYAFISAINQSIVHITDEQELLDKATNISTEVGLFKMAWIGLSGDGQNLQLRSMSGNEENAKKILRQSFDIDDPAMQNTPSVKVMRTGKYHLNNDVQNDPALALWHDEFARQGIAASISLPISRSGKVVGIFGLHAGSKDFFDKEELELLTEAAGDISFALDMMDRESERKHAQEKLGHSESILQNAQALAHMGSWEVDLMTGAIIWSDEMYQIIAVDKNHIEPSNELFLSTIHPDDAERINKAFVTTFETLLEASNTFRIIAKDDAVKHVFCEWKFDFDQYQKPLRLYGIVHDITESKKAEERLALFASIVQSTDDAIISKSLDGVVSSWNQGANRILGYTAEEMIGKPIAVLIPPHLQGEEKRILSNIQMGESVDHYETERVRKDGSIIHVSLTISPIRDAQGQIVGASKIMRDISDRKKAEEAIAKLNEKLQVAYDQLSIIFNTLPANIALVDDDGEILAVNRGWKQFADENGLLSPNHCIGENYIETCERVIGEDAETATEMAIQMRSILKNSIDEFALEYPCHSPQVKRWFRAEVRPLVDDSHSGAVVMHFNITERKEAEQEVIEMNNTLETRVKDRTTELQEANKALEAFSYSVSHDLRAPVRALIGFTSIIKADYGAGFNDDLKEMFDHINDSSRRMNAIIDDMLTLAKYEKEKLHLGEVDMSLLFRSVWGNISYTNPHHASLDLAELPTVTADSSMLQQVVVNLLSNAIKYSSKKEAPKVVVRYELTDLGITFSVSDNGAGFDMKHYDRLFGAFQRLHGASDFEGTGVGLLLVKRIIDKHGGTVWAEGKVGEGATFYFSLPV